MLASATSWAPISVGISDQPALVSILKQWIVDGKGENCITNISVFEKDMHLNHALDNTERSSSAASA